MSSNTHSNILDTWLTYRKNIKGQSIKDVLDEINVVGSTKYKHNAISLWRREKKEVPRQVMSLINGDLEDILNWLMEQPEVMVNGCVLDIKVLANKLKTPVSHPD